VRVNSTFTDGTSGVQLLSFGGNQFLNTTQQTTSLMANNTLSWFSGNNKHRLKLGTEFRRDGSAQDQTINRLGTYTYNSLTDLQAGVPVSFTRTLSPRERNSDVMIGAVSLGDSYRKSQTLQIQYGVRVDANQFLDTPARNPELEQRLGVRNDRVPNGVFVSPRIGFSWQYGTGPQIGAFEGAFRGPRAVIRGGVGVFQNSPQATLIGNAIDNTGLPSAIQQLACVGAAVPTLLEPLAPMLVSLNTPAPSTVKYPLWRPCSPPVQLVRSAPVLGSAVVSGVNAGFWVFQLAFTVRLYAAPLALDGGAKSMAPSSDP